MFTILKSQKGAALLLAVVILVLLTFLGIAVLQNSSTDVNIAGNYKTDVKAFYAAEAGISKGVSKLTKAFTDSGLVEVEPDSVTFSTEADETYDAADSSYTFSIPGSNAKVRYRIRSTDWKISGPYSVKEYFIQSAAVDSNSRAAQALQQKVTVKRSSLFRYAVFYKDDLEIVPGPDMTIRGPIHTNKNMFLSSGNNLYFNSEMTAAGYIFRGKKVENTSGGNVYIKNKSGTDIALTTSNDAITPLAGFNHIDLSDPFKGNGTSNPPSDPSDTWKVDPNWANDATSTWGGLVRDRAMGINEKPLPAVSSIERGGYYEQKAGLKVITDNSGMIRVYDQNNSLIPFSNFPAGTFTNSSFHNGREQMTVRTTDIDMTKLVASGYYPANGAIYASREDAVKDAAPNDNTPDPSRKPHGIRITNGALLPNALTFTSNNPVYVQGDFNRHTNADPLLDTWKPAGILGDAVTILSNSWSDAGNASANMQPASNTEVNAAFIAGIRNTQVQGAANYSGGLENYPRFLEDWSASKTLKWRGSFIQLWQSLFSTGMWTGTGGYYSPPIRDWGYDARFGDPSSFPPAFNKMFPAATEAIETRGGWMKMNAAASSDLIAKLLVDCGITDTLGL